MAAESKFHVAFGGCRKAGTIVIAYIGSTCLVLVWLLYTIEVNLRENEEDAEGGPRPPRVSELLKVRLSFNRYPG